MAELLTFDACIYTALLFCVVGLPWAILAAGMRSALSSAYFLDEEVPARHSALIARYQDSL